MEQVPTKVEDFLDEDPALRGQNYVCLSFLSPEDLLKSKEVYMVEKYVQKIAFDLKTILENSKASNKEVYTILNNLKDSYPHLFDPKEVLDDFQIFKRTNSDVLEKEFHEKNEFRTTVRGIKVRGVFDTIQEAKNRADFLKRKGDKFDIFIGQVGCWCPWSPNPEDIADSEYAETQLNTFMKQFKQTMQMKDEVFEARKQQSVSAITEDLTKEDPWLAQKEVSSDK